MFKSKPTWLTICVKNTKYVDIPLSCKVKVEGVQPNQPFDLVSPEGIFTNITYSDDEEDEVLLDNQS